MLLKVLNIKLKGGVPEFLIFHVVFQKLIKLLCFEIKMLKCVENGHQAASSSTNARNSKNTFCKINSIISKLV